MFWPIFMGHVVVSHGTKCHGNHSWMATDLCFNGYGCVNMSFKFLLYFDVESMNSWTRNEVSFK